MASDSEDGHLTEEQKELYVLLQSMDMVDLFDIFHGRYNSRFIPNNKCSDRISPFRGTSLLETTEDIASSIACHDDASARQIPANN